MGKFARKIAIAAIAPLLILLGAVATTTASAQTPSVNPTPGGGAVVRVFQSLTQPTVHHATAPAVYSVRSGDNLSSIAKAHNTPHGWAGLYALNRSVVGSNPNLIQVGEHLKLTGNVTSRQVEASYAALPKAPVAPPAVYYHAPIVQHTAPVTPPVQQKAPVQQQAAPAAQSGVSDLSSLPASWQCIVFHESTNRNLSYGDASSTGYFQIQQPTWGDYGGLAFAPAPYLATLDQQYQVAQRIVAGQGTTAFSTNAEYGCGI